MLLLLASLAEAQAKEIRFASGSLGDVYRDVAERTRSDLSKQGVEVQFIGSSDGAENLSHLAHGEADFGLVPQDLASEYLHMHPGHDLIVVDRLFFDDLHILIRQPLRIDRASDLNGLRFWVGEAGSASRSTTERLFDNLGISLESIDKSHLISFEDLERGEADSLGSWKMESAILHLPDWFSSRRLDAAILVTAPGTPALCSLIGSGKASLLSLDRGTLRRLAMEDGNLDNRFLRQITIDNLEAGTYPNQHETVKTVAIPVLLMARKEVDPAFASALRDALLREWSKRVSQTELQGCRLSSGVPNAKPLVQSRLPLLEGIPRPEHNPVPWFHLFLGGAMLMALGLAYWILRSDRSRLFRRVRRFLHDARTHYRWITSCFVGLLILVACSTALTFYVEREINDNFATIPESFWSITVCLFSGLEDRVPYTQAGRFGVFVALFAGGAFAVLCSALVTKEVLMTRKKMPLGMKNHFLILNWNERVSELIRELHHPSLKKSKKHPIVVLSNKKGLDLDTVVNGDGQEGEVVDVYLKPGDPTNEQSLRQANAHTAHCVLIIGTDETNDDQTIRSVLMLRKIARAGGRKDFHVIAELANPANAASLDELASDFPGLLENVAGLRVRTCLLAQAALNDGIAGFYMDLLSISDDSNEVYTQEIPHQVVERGAHFREYAAYVLEKAKDPMVPVGIQRSMNGKARVLINPEKGNDEGRLQAGDCLVLIGLKPPPPSALPNFGEETVPPRIVEGGGRPGRPDPRSQALASRPRPPSGSG